MPSSGFGCSPHHDAHTELVLSFADEATDRLVGHTVPVDDFRPCAGEQFDVALDEVAEGLVNRLPRPPVLGSEEAGLTRVASTEIEAWRDDDCHCRHGIS